jgi:hypothetical protein
MRLTFMNSDFLDISTLEKNIARQVSILFSYVNFDDMTVGIHLNSSLGKDYPRMMFILYTLSRAYATGHADHLLMSKQKEVLIVFWAIYEHAKKHLEEKDFMYVALYGMRFLNNFGESYQRLVSDFAAMNYSTLYGYPVSAYLYISAYKECEALRTGYDFSSEILSQCTKAFDFWLFSNVRASLLPFHFSELSFHAGLVPDELIERAHDVVVEKFSQGYLENEHTSSSGIVINQASHVPRVK